MPLWRRSRSKHNEWDLALDSFTTQVVGTDACNAAGCEQLNAAQCSYEDRRGQRCTTSLCPQHQQVRNQQAYCRPHAATMDALGDVPLSARPDVDNLAPALVCWVFRDLHDPVVALLDGRLRPGEKLAIDPSVRSTRMADGAWRWSQGWRVQDPTGAMLAIAVEVTDVGSTRISIRVGSQTIADVIPPWLVVRADQEVEQRQQFYSHLMQEITAAVDADRALDQHYSRFGG